MTKRNIGNEIIKGMNKALEYMRGKKTPVVIHEVEIPDKIKGKATKHSYLFEADNLGFRPVIESDIDYLLLLDADPETMSFFPGGVRSRQEIENNIKKYITFYNEKKYGIFLVFDISSGKFIGRAGFGDVDSGETEVGYLILKNHWGKGLASRILKILLDWAKNNINKDKIIAFTPLNHLASERVMQKAGMTFTNKGIMKGVECVIYEYKLG